MRTANKLAPRSDHSGIWEGTVPGVQHGQAYKYRITSHVGGYRVEKADPFATFCELPPATASRVWNLDYAWHDGELDVVARRAQRPRRAHVHL